MSSSVKVGFHSNNPSLLALSRLGILEKRLESRGVKVEWLDIPGGARTVDFIGAGLIDVGGTGASPPITAQAKGVPLVYIATSKGRPVGGILVRDDSALHTAADLRGKRVALGVGSWHQTLLATALDRSGLSWNDIVPLDIPEPLARKALAAGGIDAWATGESHPQAIAGFRFIARTEELIANPSVFFASRSFAEDNPEVLDIVVQSLDEADRWIQKNPADAAQRLSQGPASGHLKPDEWKTHIQSRPWGLVAVSQAFLDEQQRAADLFFKFGLLPRAINVREATLARAPGALREAA